jgi:hypothetical protein
MIALKALAAWFHNARLIGDAASRGEYDVVVGNETCEIAVTNFFGIHVLNPDSLDFPKGIDCRGMVPQLWRHLAACDLAVVQGGGATTLEVEALRVPFLFFPVEHQSEQEVTIANRLARHGAGVRMRVSSTSPEQMADAIMANLGVKVSISQYRRTEYVWPRGVYWSVPESAKCSTNRRD